jgi:hypothetical protein
MSDLTLHVGTKPYETTQALLDGSVTFAGIQATVDTAAIASEIFRRMVHDREFDVAEPYGLAANRTTIDTFLRYYFEQGLSIRHLTCEELFAPELLDTGSSSDPAAWEAIS